MRIKTSGYQPMSFRVSRDMCVRPDCSTEKYVHNDRNLRLDTITSVPVVLRVYTRNTFK